MADDPTPTPTPTPTGDDLAGLRSALAAERQRANALQGQLTQIQSSIGDLDLNAARAAIAERDELKAQVGGLQTQLQQREIEATANTVLNQVLPEYRDLFRTSVHSQLQVNEAGQVVTADGRSLEQVSTDLKTRYPQMFAADSVPAGAGAAPNTGGTPTTPTVVKASDVQAISQLDPVKVASGEVVIDPLQ